MNNLPSGAQKTTTFEALYREKFGIESKPEYSRLVTDLHLSAEEGMQLMEDITALVLQVFDAYFEEIQSATPRSDT